MQRELTQKAAEGLFIENLTFTIPPSRLRVPPPFTQGRLFSTSRKVILQNLLNIFTYPKICDIIIMPNELNNCADRYIFSLRDNYTLFVHTIKRIHLVKMRLPFDGVISIGV